ncbi:MAG: hypothetical protein M3Y51_11320 [Actinomycetota bacterium]|nr:hypothetical protein [Actinomycetota bacterium]
MRHELDDTDPEVRRRQIASIKAMTSAERVALADELSTAVIELSIADVRASSPDATGVQLLREVTARRFGRELADRAHGVKQKAP